MELPTTAALQLFGNSGHTAAIVTTTLGLSGDESYEIGDAKSVDYLRFDSSMWSLFSTEHEEEIFERFGLDPLGPLRWLSDVLEGKGSRLAMLRGNYDVNLTVNLSDMDGDLVLSSALLTALGELGLDVEILT